MDGSGGGEREESAIQSDGRRPTRARGEGKGTLYTCHQASELQPAGRGRTLSGPRAIAGRAAVRSGSRRPARRVLRVHDMWTQA
jgi:hypothetical protein